jgi:DNA segregation ATPase FtsK/SpoIIIE, S-DNA-T family
MSFTTLSIYLGGASLVGVYGLAIHEAGMDLFGYLVFALPIPLFYGLYRLHVDLHFERRRLEILSASMLFSLGLLIFQALVTSESIGLLGAIIENMFAQFIGTIGIMILIIAIFVIAGLLFFNISSQEFMENLRGMMKRENKPKAIDIFNTEMPIANEVKTKEITSEEIITEENRVQEIESIVEEAKSSESEVVDTLIEEPIPEVQQEEMLSEENNEEEVTLLESPSEETFDVEKMYKADEEHQTIDSNKSVEVYLEEKLGHMVQVDVASVEEDNEAKRKVALNLEVMKEPVVISSESIDKEANETETPIENIMLTQEHISEEPYEESVYIEPIAEEPIVAHTPTVEEPAPEIAKIVVPDLPKEIVLPPKNDIQKEEPKKNDVVIVNELEENASLLAQVEIGTKDLEAPSDFKLPKLSFLQEPAKVKTIINEDEIDGKINDLLEKLRLFKIEGDVVRTYSGPLVTTFEFKPAPHIKVSKILNLQDDIAMALRAETIRLQAPIPGKDVVGIEIPNINKETIYLRDVLESEIFQKATSPLTIALGKDIVGNAFVTDLKKLPHVLIAGTTGSGKSVGINAMILSLLYRNSPDDLRLLMIDPKMLEFSIYNDIPHLLTPVITKPKQAMTALDNMVKEMERRYTLMSNTRTKNIENYNEKALRNGETRMPYIVVIIDELADLMMQGGKEVEVSIARLAQMARASGIHLVVATQRPSVDVITGLIKANLPSRISYRVGQKIDSKVILDSMGAESLLGRGDLLFTPPGSVGLVRLHAPWSDEGEIEKIVEFLKEQREADYDVSFLEPDEVSASGTAMLDGDLDELYDDAKGIVRNEGKTSISYLQRRLQIGYNRAARIIEQLEQMGVLSEQNAKGQREVI